MRQAGGGRLSYILGIVLISTSADSELNAIIKFSSFLRWSRHGLVFYRRLKTTLMGFLFSLRGGWARDAEHVLAAVRRLLFLHTPSREEHVSTVPVR